MSSLGSVIQNTTKSDVANRQHLSRGSPSQSRNSSISAQARHTTLPDNHDSLPATVAPKGTYNPPPCIYNSLQTRSSHHSQRTSSNSAAQHTRLHNHSTHSLHSNSNPHIHTPRQTPLRVLSLKARSKPCRPPAHHRCRYQHLRRARTMRRRDIRCSLRVR